MRTEKEGGR
jgi:hypothetical protein